MRCGRFRWWRRRMTCGRKSSDARGSVAAHLGSQLPAPSAPTASGLAPTLTPEQVHAVTCIGAALPGFATFVLHGLTGSGKTEVYLQAIAHCLARGRQALVLIPEIGLTPQTLARFRARFHCDIAAFHSALTDHERARRCRERAEPQSARSGRRFVGVVDAVVVAVGEHRDRVLTDVGTGVRERRLAVDITRDRARRRIRAAHLEPHRHRRDVSVGRWTP